MSTSYFNDIASQWDEIRKDYFSEEVRIRAFKIAGVTSGKLAADIGAGTGFFTEGLIRRGLKVIAVDQSVSMLAELKSKFRADAPITCRIGRAGRLPVLSGEVDYAFANMYLHHVASPPGAIREMARILKPGGILVVTDLDEHDFEFLKEEQHDRWMGFDRQAIAAWFEDSGLIDVKVESVGENCCSTSYDSTSSAAISIFAASGIKPSHT